jgi:hypothetical protein
MSKIASWILILSLVFSMTGCGTTGAATASAPAPSREQDAVDAANAALAALDGGKAPAQAAPSGGGGAARPAPAASPAAPAAGPAPAAQANRGKPAWVDSPDSVYPKGTYVSAVGFGSSRAVAEKSGLANLTALFGQSIQADLKILNTYQEAVKNGAVDYKENTNVSNAINTSTSLDSLVGAEIADVWTDSGANTTYAVAVMDKGKTNSLYGEMIRANLAIIDTLVNVPAAERNTLDGFARLMLAATIADANRVYTNLLGVVGNTTGINPASLKKGDDYRLMAKDISKNIPIGVVVTGDTSDRVRGAFAKVISDAGFRSGGTNSRYVLQAVIRLSPVNLPNPQNYKYARLELDARLTDTSDDSVLLPYNLNRREGHLELTEAEQRAIRWAEGEITKSYGGVLSSFLSTLLPVKK